MDTENNSTTSETLTKTSEGGVKLPQNPTDANRNPSTGSGDSAAVETLETEEDQTNSNDVQPVSTTVVDQDKLKDTMFKNVSNENDPNSEDIELKWDDDSDIDESVLDDSVPGLIDSLEMSINMTKSHEVMKSGDDGGKTSKYNAELELMDVDTSEIDEISNKIDELIKDNDDQACAKTNIDLIKSNEDQACAKPNIAMIKSNEEKSPKFNKDNDNIITNQESQDSTPGKEITDIIEEPMIVDTFNDEESELKENFEEKQFSLETKRSSEPTMQEKIAEEEPTCSSLELMESAAEKVQQLPTLTTSSITFVKEDNILNKEDEHEMDLDTSEVTEITPNFNNVSGTKQSIEITHDDSKVVEMEQVTSVEKSNLTESPKAKSSMSILEDKQPVAGNTAEIIQEPDSSTEKLESKSDTLKKVYKSSKLSDVEDDDHIVPSKEEEDILLAEPTSTDDLVDALVIPSHVIDPIEDTSDGVNDAVDSVRNSSKNTDHVNPESSTIVTSLKESSIASGVVKKPTDAEETVVDTSDKILEVKDNFAVPTETITKDVEALKEQSDIEVMVNDALENHVDASEVPKTIETTSGLDKLTLFKEEVTESLTSVAKNIQADDSDKAQGDSDVSETISVPPMSSTDNALKNRAEIAPTTSDELLGMGDSSEVMAEASTLSETLKGESKAVLTSDGSDSIQVIPDNSDIGKITSNIEAMTTDVSDIDPKATESFIPSTSTEAEKMPQDTSEILSIAVNGVQVLPDTSDTIQKSWTSLDEIAKSSDTVKLTDEPSISPSNLNDNTKNSAVTSATPSIASDSVKELPETSDIVQKPPTNLDEVTISSDTVDLLEKPSTASETVPTASNSDQELPDTSNTVQKPPTSLDGVAKSSDSANHLEKPSTSTSDATDTLIISATSETIKMASDASGTDQKSPNCDAKTIQVPSDVTETPEQTANKPEKALSPKPSTSSGIQPPLAPDTSADLTQMTDNQGLLSESARPLEDTSDEVPEFTDSLGLLAESSGPMDEEEEPDMEDEDDADDDEEPEDDQDDESNHPTTADQSEDSNAQTSETDAPNPIDIEISEDSFADKLRATEMVVDDMLGGTEKVNEAGDIDVDKEFDKLIASVMPGKQKIVSEAEQLKSPDKPDDSMDVDDAKPTDSTTAADGGSVLRKILTASKDVPPKAATPRGLDQDKGADTPTKAQKLARCSNGSMSVVNIVDLEESSSEDDVLDTTGDAKPASPVPETDEGSKEDAVKQDSTVVKPAAPKAMLRLNTDELTIKTAVAGAESTLVIPEAKLEDIPQPGKPSTPKFSLEVFSLDSDEEDSGMKANDNKEPSPEKPSASANAPATAPAPARCGNPRCADSGTAPALKLASKRAPALCENCTQLLEARLQALTQGVMDLTPLLRLEAERPESELVEISDSDSDDGGDDKPLRAHQPLGQLNAKYLEEELADMINETWRKYKLDDRLTAATDELASQMAQLEKDQVDVNTMLDECQVATDTLRRELYAAFAVPQRQLPSIEIFDTIHAQYAKIIDETESSDSEPVRRSKRPRVQSKDDNQAKRPAIPLGFTGDDMKKEPADDGNAKVDDDNTDIKVIALSAEAAPTGLPALGTLTRQPVAVGMTVFAMKHAFGAWQKATVLQAPPRGNQPYTTCKVRFEHKSKTNIATISARHLAYAEPASVRLTIGTRVIALFCDIIDQNKRKSYYSGVVAEMPNPVNSYRYLVFFDDGYAQYVSHSDTRVVCECSPLVWEEVHPFSREFVHTYLRAYPERPMVRLHAGQTIKTEWNGKWWVSRVIQVDASLVQVHFEADNRYEWIYRGSTRLAPLYLELQAAEKHRARPLPRSTQGKRNMPYVEYTRFDEQDSNKTTAQLQLQDEEIKRQRAVAKKSTGPQNNQQAALPALSQDAVMSRVVYYTPKAAVKPHKMIPHTCSIKCKRTDVLPLKELRTYNPLARPLLSGWERQLVRHKGRKEVMYRAPCGRRLRNVRELHRYLRATAADMAVDLFDFSPATHCLAEFVLNRCLVSKKDLSHGKENVPVPCVNYYDTSLPEFCSYNTERTPTAGVPLNLDPEFLCGCDCDDDCQDKTKCKCWQMTLGGARTVGQDGPYVGYLYKRLLEPVPSGIYECNSRCKCKHTCLNRVAQHPLQLKLQVFKTPNRGWGIRALNDVPKGAFLCVYAGNLLTDATANLDGLNEGDEYLAELDYIEVVEQMKEGYEEDVPEKDKELDRASKGSAEAESDSASSSEDERKADQADGDFRPLVPLNTQQTFSKRLRRREKKTKDNEEKQKEAETKGEQPPAAAGEKEKGDCITISDDEEVREPSRFMAQTDMGDNEHVSKYRSVRSLYGKDEACYIMDAKVQGNIGRYLNHSCCPNVFVQNVFVDTHDPRFPWVAFFALSHIRAGTELTWNYNYDVGSVPDKVLYCYCGAPNCRGRLL